MAKVRLIVEGEYEFDDENLESVYDENNGRMLLTAEQVQGLSDQQKVTFEHRALQNGDFDLQDLISYMEVDSKTMKLELVEPDA